MSSSPRSRSRSTAVQDVPPVPPVEPALEDCCGSGCDPCIFDLYEQARERYEQARLAWEQRQQERPQAGSARRKPAAPKAKT